MKNVALPRIQKMKPYSPPLAGRRAFTGMLLDFNEKTVPPSAKVLKAIQELLLSNTLQVYPEYGNLEKKISQFVGVSAKHVMITNGSDQAIDLIFRTFTQAGDTVIIPTPSFAMFTQSAHILGNTIFQPFYKKEDLSFPLDELLEMIDNSVKLIVVCNPNNPTGTAISVKNIEKIAKKASNAILLVDEAYVDYAKITAVPLIKKYPNIVVVRTMSKAFGLPSLRIGYVIASEMYINELLKVRGPYDVNMIAYTAASAALSDVKEIQKYSDEVMNQSKPMLETFFTQNNITFYPSAANFLLYKPLKEKEAEILEQNGILVRPQDKTNIEGTLRLTIGTVSQTKRFIKIYQSAILKQSKKKKVAFLDRDGTLIFEPQDTFQIDSLEKLHILEGAITGLKKLIEQGYELVMVSNQDGLGTPSFPKENFIKPHQRMLQIFEKNGIAFSDICICPHMPSKKCACRKPKIGLLKKFLRKNNIDNKKSFVCGDRATDEQLAKNIGVAFVPIQTNSNFYEALSEGGIAV